MKLFIGIFLWIVMIYHAIHILATLLTTWGPLSWMTENDNSSWKALAGLLGYLCIGILVSAIIYKFLHHQKTTIPVATTVLLGVLLITYTGLSFLWDPLLMLIHILFALVMGTILILYPRIVKKYY